MDRNFFGSDKASTISVRKTQSTFYNPQRHLETNPLQKLDSAPVRSHGLQKQSNFPYSTWQKALIITALEHKERKWVYNAPRSDMHSGTLIRNNTDSISELTLTSSQLMTLEFETRMGPPEPQSTNNFVSWLFEGVLTDLGLQGIVENAITFPR